MHQQWAAGLAHRAAGVEAAAMLRLGLLLLLALLHLPPPSGTQLPPLDIPTDLMHHADARSHAARGGGDGIALESLHTRHPPAQQQPPPPPAPPSAPRQLPGGQVPQPPASSHIDRAKQFQQEQERTRAEFAAKSRAHAESIASLRADHSEAARTMEAENRAKMVEHEQEHLERQREAETRRQEPVNPGAMCATAGAVAELGAEVAAMQDMLRGIRAEMRLRFDGGGGGGGGGTGGSGACTEPMDGDSDGGAEQTEVTLPLSIR